MQEERWVTRHCLGKTWCCSATCSLRIFLRATNSIVAIYSSLYLPSASWAYMKRAGSEENTKGSLLHDRRPVRAIAFIHYGNRLVLKDLYSELDVHTEASSTEKSGCLNTQTNEVTFNTDVRKACLNKMHRIGTTQLSDEMATCMTR
ncbi:predicted protein [Plenodomus lingam JN3]|uniref:Predicted protein n=2 Tax=Leptosphaeria maculans TaxID=5022 RepID=E5R5G3_LEPMJ|nr:predicted protein [Plenodomus lingam JN3]CBX92133.1 predicted protein [Plenodomus lingam JN3]